MPHSCIGALSYYHHNFMNYVTSDEAKRVMEATAAGTAVYQTIWKPLRRVLLSVIVIIVASFSVTKLDISEAALFAHRMQPCLYPPVIRLPSPEPVRNSPKRDASLYFGHGHAAISQADNLVISFCNAPT